MSDLSNNNETASLKSTILPKSSMSRRDFLLNSLLSGAGVLIGGTAAYGLGRLFLRDQLPKINIPQESALYFLTHKDIQTFIKQSDSEPLASVGSEMQTLLTTDYHTEILDTAISLGDTSNLFAETQIGIEIVPYFTETMRYAESRYEVRQIAIGELTDGSPFAIPVNTQDYTSSIDDIASRSIIMTGDSFTYAIGVDYDDSFANRLAASNHLNLVVFGHGTEDQLRRFQNYLSLSAINQNLTAKVVIHCIHPNDLINDLVSNFYWQFYQQNPRSYFNDFTPRFANLMQQARDNHHSGLGYYAVPPSVTSEANRIALQAYQYNPNEARFVPQLNLIGLLDNPIICDPEMNYFAGTIATLAAQQGFDVESLIIDEDFSTEIKFAYADGTIAATGYHRLGGLIQFH